MRWRGHASGTGPHMWKTSVLELRPHNDVDIGPTNVTLNSKNEAFFINLFSSKPLSDKPPKGVTHGGTEHDVFDSAKWNDTDALAKLETYLLKRQLA